MSTKYIRIKSRHPSHSFLRRAIKSDKKVLVRFGSTTPTNKVYDLIINSVESIKNAKNKLRMKTKFLENKVKTCDWALSSDIKSINAMGFPLVAKHIYGSKGTGNYKLDNEGELKSFLQNRAEDLDLFIIEKYTSFSREYRLHVTNEGCFYTCRKLRKNDTKEENRWKFNNDTCVWILEENDSFNKPETWKLIVKDCILALNSVGLTIGACDVRVSKKGSWKIIEINSAPALGDIGKEKYFNKIKELVCAD